MEEQEPYTPEFAAARLKVEAAWLRKQAAKGLVPSLKLGRRRLFLEKHLQQILTAAEREKTAGLTTGSARAMRRAS